MGVAKEPDNGGERNDEKLLQKRGALGGRGVLTGALYSTFRTSKNGMSKRTFVGEGEI